MTTPEYLELLNILDNHLNELLDNRDIPVSGAEFDDFRCANLNKKLISAGIHIRITNMDKSKLKDALKHPTLKLDFEEFLFVNPPYTVEFIKIDTESDKHELVIYKNLQESKRTYRYANRADAYWDMTVFNKWLQ